MLNNGIISYFFESSISLAILYLFYWFILRKETYFLTNRLFLLGAVIFSSVLPFINFSIQGFDTSNSSILGFFTRIGNSVNIPEVVKIANQNPEVNHSLNWYNVALYVYLSGVIVLSLKLIAGIIKVLLLVKKQKVKKYQGLPLIFGNQKFAPFSFFNLIFINKSLVDVKQFDKIIAHEYAHIRQLHTIDILIIELFVIIQWFNPIIWLVKRSLKETHEYLADKGVVMKGFDIAKYQSLLLYQIKGFRAVGLTNNFNKSLLKKRIIMMLKTKSSGPARFKVLLFVPILLTIIMIFACSKSENIITENEPQKEALEPQTNTVTKSDANVMPPDPVFYIVEEMPDFQGKGIEGFRDWITKNLRYPEIAANNGISGRVYVMFVIEPDGSISLANVARGVHPSLDAEAIRVLKSSPKWTPGKQRGKNVRVAYTIPIEFEL